MKLSSTEHSEEEAFNRTCVITTHASSRWIEFNAADMIFYSKQFLQTPVATLVGRSKESQSFKWNLPVIVILYPMLDIPLHKITFRKILYTEANAQIYILSPVGSSWTYKSLLKGHQMLWQSRPHYLFIAMHHQTGSSWFHEMRSEYHCFIVPF